MTLEGAHVVVVGGSSGIGMAAAALAHAQGAHVTIAGRSEGKLAQAQHELGDVRTVASRVVQAHLRRLLPPPPTPVAGTPLPIL